MLAEDRLIWVRKWRRMLITDGTSGVSGSEFYAHYVSTSGRCWSVSTDHIYTLVLKSLQLRVGKKIKMTTLWSTFRAHR